MTFSRNELIFYGIIGFICSKVYVSTYKVLCFEAFLWYNYNLSNIAKSFMLNKLRENIDDTKI